jgi:predicted transposase/invertase (TIGR01784 family)
MSFINRLDPRIDIAFKKIFGVEENKDLLISLINSIVDPQDNVVDITLLNPYNVQNFKTDKLSILDIKATNSEGKRFNIEMQITDEGDYSERALYYWAKMYTEQLNTGGKYSDLCKTIGIHILNFSSIHDDRYHHQFRILDTKSHDHHFENFEMHTLELQKFTVEREDLTDLVKRIQSSLDVWMAFLTRNELLVQGQLPPELNDTCINKAIGVLDVMGLGPIEREIYENRQKFLMIEEAALEHQYATGKAEGLAEGLAEGELRAKLEMAINLLKHNVSEDVILSASGLTLLELKKLAR